VRLTSWNILHGAAIPPNADSDKTLTSAVAAVDADVMAFQEIDHFLPRSQSRPQIRDIAESIGALHWAMGPSVIGTPGESWRKKHDHEPEIITHGSSHSELMHECYGIAIASRIPVLSWHRLDLGRSPLGLPLIVPSDETGKGKPRFLYVKDEPRLALAAVLENGWTVINTHLSFVPLLNLRQLRRVKQWGLKLASETSTRVVIVGDLNLPFGIPTRASHWKSLINGNSYPSWGPSIQFDYILSPDMAYGEFAKLEIPRTGISDHLPIGVEIFE